MDIFSPTTELQRRYYFPITHHDIGLIGWRCWRWRSWSPGYVLRVYFSKSVLRALFAMPGAARCKDWLTNLPQLMKEISIFLNESFYRQVLDKKPETYCLWTVQIFFSLCSHFDFFSCSCTKHLYRECTEIQCFQEVTHYAIGVAAAQLLQCTYKCLQVSENHILFYVLL